MKKINYFQTNRLRFVTFIGTILLIGLTNSKLVAQTLADDPIFELVFVDDFASLDTSKWNHDWGWGPNLFNTNKIKSCIGSGFINDTVDIAYCYKFGEGNSRSFLTSGGVTFERLISKKENVTRDILLYDAAGNANGSAPKPFKFTTAMLKGKDYFKYGYFEIRFRTDSLITQSNGYNAYGPNFWMWNSNDALGANYSEIDIFEINGVQWKMGPNCGFRIKNPNTPGTPYEHTLFQAMTLSNPSNSIYSPFLVSSTPGDWQTVGCEWVTDYVDFYYYSLSSDTSRRYAQNKIAVSNLIEMPLVIDTYTPAFQYCIPFNNANTTLPFNYDIDYVKVYQQKQDCSSKSFSGEGSASYQSKVYKDVTVENSIFSSGTHHICGQDFVQLGIGFEITGNCTVIIDNKKCLSGQGFTHHNTPANINPYEEDISTEILNFKSQ
jgi:hypothetical protein